MKHVLLLLVVCLIVAAGIGDGLLAQVTSGNGYLGYNINLYGRIRVDLYPYTNRQYDKITAMAGVSEDLVFDYMDNSENVAGPALVAVPGVDDAIVLMTDGSYTDDLGQSSIFKNLRVGYLLMAWTDMPYIVVRMRFYNDSTDAITYYLGAYSLPRVSGTYGGETVVWDAPTETAYFYRTGETPHWGIRLLRHPTYSVHMLDWNVYSTDPNNEVSVDSIRFQLVGTTGFDNTLTAGPDGSVFNVNRGPVTIAARDSADIEYVVAYGGSPAEVIAACDSGQVRYDKFLTSVPAAEAGTVPSRMLLHQNYPNPFNPTTVVRFHLPASGQAGLPVVSNVKLVVYDLLGREVAVLVNERKPAGMYDVQFDASGLPSGVYVYRLTAGQYVESRKMVLMK